MSVQMKTNVRSEFMISDASMSRQNTQVGKEQTSQFKQMLGDTSQNTKTQQKTKPTGDQSLAMNRLQDDKRYEKALKALDAEISRVISEVRETKAQTADSETAGVVSEVPSDPKELAKLIVKGKIDVKDVPDEAMTEEVLKEIIALMIEVRYDESGEPAEDDEQAVLFDPAAAAVNEQNRSRDVSDLMLRELYGIIEKHNEEQAEPKVTILDGISEPIETDETGASIATAELHAEEKASEGVFEEIIDQMVEQTETVQTENGTQTERTETSTATNVGQAITEEADAAELVQGAENAQSNGAQTNADSSDGTALNVGQAENAQRTENVNEIENEFGNVIEKISVKEASVSQSESREEIPQSNSSEQPRVQNASEELQMLKNAKLGKKDGETDTNSLASQMSDDRAVILTRADGTEIEVKPTEIIDQTAKLIERAVQETKEQSEYSLVLNPEELGRITVKLVKAADGAVSVTIAAENAHTQRVLEQHSELMQNNLRNSGINLEEWQTVSESRQETYAQDYNGSSKNPYFRRDTNPQQTDDENGGATFADIIAAM